MRLVIDGNFATGGYLVNCEGGDSWSGQAEPYGSSWSPALPIAECVVHMNLSHQGERADIQFTKRFESWLEYYWEWESLRQAGTIAGGR